MREIRTKRGRKRWRGRKISSVSQACRQLVKQANVATKVVGIYERRDVERNALSRVRFGIGEKLEALEGGLGVEVLLMEKQ